MPGSQCVAKALHSRCAALSQRLRAAATARFSGQSGWFGAACTRPACRAPLRRYLFLGALSPQNSLFASLGWLPLAPPSFVHLSSAALFSALAMRGYFLSRILVVARRKQKIRCRCQMPGTESEPVGTNKIICPSKPRHKTRPLAPCTSWPAPSCESKRTVTGPLPPTHRQTSIPTPRPWRPLALTNQAAERHCSLRTS